MRSHDRFVSPPGQMPQRNDSKLHFAARIKIAYQGRVSLHGLLVVKVAVTGGGHDDVMATPGCPHPPYDPLHRKISSVMYTTSDTITLKQ